MKVQNYREFRRDDFPDAPEWYPEAVQGQDDFLRDVNTALQGRLSLVGNHNIQPHTIEVEHNVAMEFSISGVNGTPIGFIHINAVDTNSANWSAVDQAKFRLKVGRDSTPKGECLYTFAADPGAPVEVTFLIIGE